MVSWVLFSIGWGYGSLPDSTMPLSQQILTYPINASYPVKCRRGKIVSLIHRITLTFYRCQISERSGNSKLISRDFEIPRDLVLFTLAFIGLSARSNLPGPIVEERVTFLAAISHRVVLTVADVLGLSRNRNNPELSCSETCIKRPLNWVVPRRLEPLLLTWISFSLNIDK